MSIDRPNAHILERHLLSLGRWISFNKHCHIVKDVWTLLKGQEGLGQIMFMIRDFGISHSSFIANIDNLCIKIHFRDFGIQHKVPTRPLTWQMDPEIKVELGKFPY